MIVTDKQLASFFNHGMSGMAVQDDTLLDPIPSALFARCTCGRPISANKIVCRACADRQIVDLAKDIRSTEMLQTALALAPVDRRDALFARLRPHLSIEVLDEVEKAIHFQPEEDAKCS